MCLLHVCIVQIYKIKTATIFMVTEGGVKLGAQLSAPRTVTFRLGLGIAPLFFVSTIVEISTGGPLFVAKHKHATADATAHEHWNSCCSATGEENSSQRSRDREFDKFHQSSFQ